MLSQSMNGETLCRVGVLFRHATLGWIITLSFGLLTLLIPFKTLDLIIIPLTGTRLLCLNTATDRAGNQAMGPFKL